MTILTALYSAAAGIILVAILLGLARALKGPDGASRVVVADLMYFSLICLVGFIGTLAGYTIVFDVVLIGGLLGAVSTIALSRVINGGHR